MKNPFISLMKAMRKDLAVFFFTDFMHMNYGVLLIPLFEKLFLFLCQTEFNSVTIYMLNRYSQPIRCILYGKID